MSGNRGCIFNSIMFLVIVFVPVVGHIILTIMVLEDDHSLAGTALWLAIIWLIPFLGPLLYLLFGQHRRRFMFGQTSYGYNQYQYQPMQHQPMQYQQKYP
jgi:Phospholipase_D-nuclease N-terminal